MPRLRTLVLAISTALAATAAFADDSNTPTMQQVPSQFSVDYLNINMPDGQPSMGLVGIHYDAQLLPIKDFYTGVGAYGAATGNQGGFFTLGVDNSYRPHLYGPWYLNTGLYVGGGGARSSQTGGGLMIMPYGGLAFKVDHVLLSLNYSYVTFPTGKISSGQVLFGLTVPLDFDYFNASDDSYKRMSFSSFHLPNNTQGVTHEWYVSPMIQDYHTTTGHSNTNLNGQPLNSNLGLVGFEAGRYFTQNFYAAVRTMGLAHGNANGYMNVMAGPGYQIPLGHTGIYSVSDVMIGAGGGGEIDTRGGFLAEADTGLAWQMTPSFSPKFMIGYLTAPNGNFNTWVYTVGLNYNFGLLGASNHGSGDLLGDAFTLKHWRISINNQTLFDPSRTSTSTGNINSIGVNLDQFLTPSVYISYRSAFAYQGQRTGGMAEGMIGVGWQHNSLFGTDKLIPHVAFLGGAIGGGAINAGGGLIVEPEVGLTYALTPTLGFDVSGGRMLSIEKSLNSNVLTMGVSVTFGEAQKL